MAELLSDERLDEIVADLRSMSPQKFTAAACDAIEALRAEVERLKAQVEELQRALDERMTI